MTIWPPSGFRRTEDRLFLREWLSLGCIGIAFLAVMIACNVTQSADRLAYDWLLQQHSYRPSGNIVIVTIDDESLAQLGRWPWTRDCHAAALRWIAAGAPRAVIYDVLFTEPSPEDATLAQAMTLAPVYLPLLIRGGQTNGSLLALPVEPLRKAAAGIGHINLGPSRDGVVRSVSLAEGMDERIWPQLVVPAFRAVLRPSTGLRREKTPSYTDAAPADPPRLSRNDRMLIPFAGASQPYSHVSFVSVLRGEISPSFFLDKYVLVGASAGGLSDYANTPIGPMAGVEIHANILDALLSGRSIHQGRRWLIFGMSVVPLMLLFAGFLFLTPRQSILLVPALAGLTFVSCATLLLHASTWITPVPAIIALVIVYPLWNWRRLEVAMSFIGEELERLAVEPQLVQGRRTATRSGAGNALERNIVLMKQAAQQVRDLKRFVWDSLNSLPDPVLVADRNGRIQLVNQPARVCLIEHQGDPHEDSTLQDLLKPLTFVGVIVEETGAAHPACRQWPQLLDPGRPEHTDVMERGVEVRDAFGRHYVLKYARCMNANGQLIGWIANLTDVSTLHAAQSQRDEMLHLLSHDMRSPQSSIVALIELERPKVAATGTRLAFDRIERYARRALALADSFVQLAAAEIQEYTFEDLNFADLLHRAVDEVWPLANAKHIEIDCFIEAGGFPVRAERSMIARALVNLLNNATKYSPPNTHIECTLTICQAPAPYIECRVRDHGYGIPHEQIMRLFERFQRFRTPGQPDSDGVGLGLAFVKTVVTRHGGTIRCESALGHGTTMTIQLPCAAET